MRWGIGIHRPRRKGYKPQVSLGEYIDAKSYGNNGAHDGERDGTHSPEAHREAQRNHRDTEAYADDQRKLFRYSMSTSTGTE